MADNKFVKNLIAIELELGFVRIPSKFISLFPKENSKINVRFSDGKTYSLTYDPKNNRVYGLKNFYKNHKAETKDGLEVEKVGDDFKFHVIKLKESEKKQVEITKEEAEQVIDLSNLSTQAKGNVVESRIAELIMLYGQGLLNVYKPLIDIEGIDLIVLKHGVFQPIFLQVKSRYVLHANNSLLVDIGDKTLKPHHTYFLVGAYLNPKTLEINDDLLLMPTEDIDKVSMKINSKGDVRHRLIVSLKENSNQRLTKYLVKKTDFVDKLLKKFGEIEKYYK